MSDNGLDKRGLRTRKTLSNAIDKELYEKLDDFAKETRIPKSKLLDEAIELLLQKHNKI